MTTRPAAHDNRLLGEESGRSLTNFSPTELERVSAAVSAKLVASGGKVKTPLPFAINGAVLTNLSARSVADLRRDPAIKVLEPCLRGKLASVRVMPTGDSHLDRVDQRELTKDNVLRSTAGGTGRNVYIMDCGVNSLAGDRPTTRLRQAFVASGLSGGLGDSHPSGHGSMMASIAAGNERGIAYASNMVSIKICDGINVLSDKVIEGVNYLLASEPPGVVNMSFYVVRSPGHIDLSAMRTAVQNLVSAGFVVIAAAGNDNLPITGTYVYSPAEAPAAFTVAAANYSDVAPDARLGNSNYGSEVDMFAPGILQGRDAVGTLVTQTATSGAAALVSGTVTAAGEYRPANTQAQNLDLIKARARLTPVANANSPNSYGQLFTDLGTVANTTIQVASAVMPCLTGYAVVPFLPVATVADSAGNLYVASHQNVGAVCGNWGLNKGPLNFRVQKLTVAGSVMWTTDFVDPTPTNFITNDSIADLALSADGTRLLIAATTEDSTRFTAPVVQVFSSGAQTDAYGLSLDTSSGAPVWLSRIGTAGVDLARTAFWGNSPTVASAETAFIGGTVQGTLPGASPLQGLNDAFFWGGAKTNGAVLVAGQLSKPGNVMINDGFIWGSGTTYITLVGATNTDPISGFALGSYDEMAVFMWGGSENYRTRPSPNSDDQLTTVSSDKDALMNERVFVTSLSRPFDPVTLAYTNLNTGRIERLPDNTVEISTPVWTKSNNITSSVISSQAATAEDIYWLSGKTALKVSKREGQEAFGETATSGTTKLSFAGGDSLWLFSTNWWTRKLAR